MKIFTETFGYEIVEEQPLTYLENFKDHHRLQVFYNKGCTCVKCGLVGTKLCLGIANDGSLHWDIYSADYKGLTVDHTIPKSKGGSDHLDNLEPMCAECNFGKGNGDVKNVKRILRNYVRDVKFEIGDLVFVKSKKRFREIGVIDSFCINPHTDRESIRLKDKTSSMYHVSSLYKISE